MENTHESLRQICLEYFRRFSNKDIVGIADLFAEKIILRDWQQQAQSKSELLAINRGLFDEVKTIDVKVAALHIVDRTAIAELSIAIDGDQEVLKVVDILEFDLESKIVCIRAYRG